MEATNDKNTEVRAKAIAALRNAPPEKLMSLIEAYLPLDYRGSIHRAIARLRPAA